MANKSTFLEELNAMKARMEELYLRNFEIEESEPEPETQPEGWLPLTDIISTEKELVYSLDLPGVLEQDLQVECKADRLWVYGTRRVELQEGEAIRIERPQGAFSRVFKFPCPIRSDEIVAEFKKGVLRIVVPRECSENTHAQKVFVRRED